MDWNQRFIVLDIETTGLNYEYWDEPTEIAAIEIINKKITGNVKHYYLKPYKKVELDFLNKVFGKNLLKETGEKNFKTLISKNEKNLKKEPENIDFLNLKEKINHVISESNNMLNNINNGKNKKYILPELREFIGDSIVVGHNISFDFDFLNFWNNELGLKLYTKRICTFKNFKRFYKLKENNLTACCNYYNIDLKNAHNALDDTKATANLFLEEINNFELECEEFSELEAYVNYKKRITKARYFDFARMVLNDSGSLPQNIENLSEIEINYCENLFFKFKKPLEVSNITGLDLGSVESIFLNWINCININKHLDLIKDKYLANTVKEILKYSNRDYELIEYANKELTGKNLNYFIFKLYEKLEYEKDKMTYVLNDFEFYFFNMKNLNDLMNKIEKDEDFIYSYLLKWINFDNKNFLLYKKFLKTNYKENPVTKTENSLKKVINEANNKDYILKQLSII